MDIVQIAATCYIITEIVAPIILVLILLGLFVITLADEWVAKLFDNF